MSLRDDILPTVAGGWQIVQDLGFASATITIRTRRWSGGQVKLGSPQDSDTTLSPNAQTTERGDGELQVYAITPAFSGGGYTPAQLNPEASGDSESYWIVTDDNGTHNYKLHSLDTSDDVEYKAVLRALTRAVPF